LIRLVDAGRFRPAFDYLTFCQPHLTRCFWSIVMIDNLVVMKNRKTETKNFLSEASFNDLLKKQSRMIIAFIVPELTSSFYTQAFNAIENKAAEQGYSIMVGQTHGQLEKEILLLQQFAARQVAGIIISTYSYRKEYKQFFELEQFDIPIIFLNNIPHEKNISFVASEFTDGLTQGIKALLHRGHQRFGFINGPENLDVSRLLETAYINALTANELTINERSIVNTNLSAEGNALALHQLMIKKDAPEIIFVFDEHVLFDCLSFTEKNKKSKIKIHFISFTALPKYVSLKSHLIGYVEQFPAIQGASAANFILQAIHTASVKAVLNPSSLLVSARLVLI
jgi:DNA-binding LacI/PurR family transcriptional regulator